MKTGGAPTEEQIEALARVSGVRVVTVRKLFARGTRACSVATNRAIFEAAEKIGVLLDLVEEPEEKSKCE